MFQWYNKNVGYLYTDGCKNTPILDIFFAKKLQVNIYLIVLTIQVFLTLFSPKEVHLEIRGRGKPSLLPRFCTACGSWPLHAGMLPADKAYICG